MPTVTLIHQKNAMFKERFCSFFWENNYLHGCHSQLMIWQVYAVSSLFSLLSELPPSVSLFQIPLLLGRGDNLQLFISPLLKYEGWLYNIIDDKNFEINSLEPPCTGGLNIPHTPMGTCRNAKN